MKMLAKYYQCQSVNIYLFRGDNPKGTPHIPKYLEHFLTFLRVRCADIAQDETTQFKF